MSTAPPWQSFATFARTRDAFLLSVLTKRSYRWDARGVVAPLEEQPPLAADVEHATRDDRNGTLLARGRDLWPLKLATDVIVTGHARAPGGVPTRRLRVGVSVGDARRDIVALGARYVEYRGPGNLVFSESEPFTEVELSWWNAYGGVDPFVLPQGLRDTPVFAGKPVLELFPGAYPRNPCGLGYLIEEHPALLDGLSLPLLEDPAHRLTPETLLTRDPTAWGSQPRPAGFGWCHSLWFPRIVQAGGKPYHLPRPQERGRLLRELELGALEQAQLLDPEARYPNARWAQEAAPEMIFPFLKGDEVIGLEGFDILGHQSFQLPAEQPAVSARVDGVELDLHATALHTVAIDADQKQFYLLRSHRFVLPDSLAGDLSDGEPLDDLHERCAVSVAGRRLEPDQWPATQPNPE